MCVCVAAAVNFRWTVTCRKFFQMRRHRGVWRDDRRPTWKQGKTQTLSAGTVWLGTNPVSRVCLLICNTGMTIIALCQSWADTQRIPGTGWSSRQVLSPASSQPQPGLSHVAYSGGQSSWVWTSIYTPEDTWLHFLWTQEKKTFL